MVQATKFLLRWLYLNNLIRDRAEIQLLPHIQHHQQHHEHYQQHHQYQDDNRQDSSTLDIPYVGVLQQDTQNYHIGQYSVGADTTANTHPMPTTSPQLPHNQQYPNEQERIKHSNHEEEWKRKVLLAIAHYPPGSSRLLALDSLRLEIVHEFSRALHETDCTISNSYRSNHFLKKKKNCATWKDQLQNNHENEGNQDDDMEKIDDIDNHEINLGNTSDVTSINVEENTQDEEVNDPYLDDDLQFIQTFQEATSRDLDLNEIGLETSNNSPDAPLSIYKGKKQSTNDDTSKEGTDEEPAVLVISPSLSRRQTLTTEDGSSMDRSYNHQTNSNDEDEAQEQQKVKDALSLHRETREYLP